MKKLLAKFKVGSVVDYGNNNVEANLSAVTNDSDANKSFSIYTPSASLKIHITNPDTLNFFKPSKEYYLSFTDTDDSHYCVSETYVVPNRYGFDHKEFHKFLDKYKIKYTVVEDATIINTEAVKDIFTLGMDFKDYINN